MTKKQREKRKKETAKKMKTKQKSPGKNWRNKTARKRKASVVLFSVTFDIEQNEKRKDEISNKISIDTQL